ncbi:acyltransferase family protein [Neobacillus terrae]|uniref:acyltransferase family protein n=1 Tax=Neobacillus terrae TaxID=3034837 RepID=UPI00140B49F7|nr:acyltransferase family protein [Neobacillus terrae]NHM29999.1 acyltransferase family protein [Neobacillus terrae]
MPASNRIPWIDACKGIGIFLVIIGHSTLTAIPRSQIFAFHMPLFFFLSGFLFSPKNNFKEFALNKVKTLLIPYFSFAVISLLIYSHYTATPIDLYRFIESTVSSKRNYIYYNVPLWFLTSLFTIEILFYFITKLVRNKFAILGVALSLGFFAFTILKVVNSSNILPWSLDQSLFYFAFFGFGHFLRLVKWLERDLKKSWILILLSGLFLWNLNDSTLYQQGWQLLHLPPLISLYLNRIIWALLAISFVIYISQYLSISPLLNFIGKNSLTLMALHVIVGFNIFNRHFRRDLLLEDHPNVLALILTVFTILLLLPLSYIINHFFPFLLGRKYKWKLPKLINPFAKKAKSPSQM